MNRRTLTVIFLSLTLGGLAYAGAFLLHQAHHDRQMPADVTVFDWFCREFAVTGAQREKIWDLHEAYFPECEEFCVHYATTRQDLMRQMEKAPDERARAELIQLRQQADQRFLEFVYEVAGELEPHQGERYLARMKGWLEEVEARAQIDVMKREPVPAT